jgi:aminopeptidase
MQKGWPVTADLTTQLRAYADLIVRSGVNLQPGQALIVVAELAHREFARLLAETAYEAGARFVDIEWLDPLTSRIRFKHGSAESLDFVPEYEVPRAHEMLETGWARVRLTGTEYPDAFEDVDPALMRRAAVARISKLKFWQEAMMNNENSWCVAGAPTAAWAQKVFPDLDEDAAVERLWGLVLSATRADLPDPQQAWAGHDARLKQVAAFMDRHQVRAVRFLDETPGPDGRPATDLTIGLTTSPRWDGGSAVNAQGLPFYPNLPTEEVFTSPHRERTEGWVRTSKPGFPFDREVLNATFRFEKGEVVAWQAEKGQDALDQLFEIPGARRLGEVALVDVRSPINQSGLVFYDTLYDENAVCHIAFGRAYPEGVQGGSEMSREELDAMGLNASDTHEDLMIGTLAMQVTGTCADGSEVLIMRDGMFLPEVVGDA